MKIKTVTVITEGEAKPEFWTHRIPERMTLSMHLAVEKLLLDHYSEIFQTHRFKIFRPFLNFIHGIICGYGLTEIMRYIIHEWRMLPLSSYPYPSF